MSINLENLVIYAFFGKNFIYHNFILLDIFKR